MRPTNVLKVLLTTDVEVWPTGWDLGMGQFEQDFRKYIYGPTSDGEYGLPVQLSLLNKFGVKAVFLVESLFACEFGIEPLAEIVDLVQKAGQEVQLHLHPEWVGRMGTPLLEGRSARRLSNYNLADQTNLVRVGLDNLTHAGVDSVNAFRAGGYAANRDTLIALRRNGISFDTSYNPCVLGDISGIAEDGPLLQPIVVEGVTEFPVSCFQDWPGHLRHAQLGACSFGEMANALNRAWQLQWEFFVIVLHGFELLTPSKTKRDVVVSRRFEQLLRFLARHRDRFLTLGFGDIAGLDHQQSDEPQVIRSNPGRTALRYAEQVSRRIFQ